MKRTKEIIINQDMSIQEIIEPGKIKILVLDGNKGTASSCEAVNHGETVIETVNGQSRRIHFRESELI
ncbi:XtrA/YqaO family protein [Niallia nealsonii]|uniref:Terminase n=1 Tax=Niallia nealsonii TaxID=115979 RepID=A0A2N0Z339_9BACI|nr:XtrA/YqaO family protein [Niallia nealsonii]PKG23933.1 terminase [Niallia nealsonii]